MWWNRIIFGIDGYEVVMWFLTYSMMGWLVESIYMSFCNHKITNRGFAKGPFCPIYGFGALTVFFVLRPYSDNSILLFFLGSFLATTLEFLTALVMKHIFGEIWWDYHGSHLTTGESSVWRVRSHGDSIRCSFLCSCRT